MEKTVDFPRTLGDHLLLETHSKNLARNRIRREEKKSHVVESNECSNLDIALLKYAYVNLYFSFIFPATLSTSVCGSKAGCRWFDGFILSHPDFFVRSTDLFSYNSFMRFKQAVCDNCTDRDI